MGHGVEIGQAAHHEDLVRSAERGMTLVEILVALTLLATALLGLAAIFPLALGGIATGGARTTATFLARQSLETARHTPYDRLASLDTGGLVPVPSHDGFARSIGIAGATPTTRTTTVTVVVRFVGAGEPGPGGGGLETRLESVLAE